MFFIAGKLERDRRLEDCAVLVVAADGQGSRVDLVALYSADMEDGTAQGGVILGVEMNFLLKSFIKQILDVRNVHRI